VDDVKRGYRDAKSEVKEQARKVDGNSPADAIGNAGDDARDALGNAGDTLGKAKNDMDDGLDKRVDSDKP
jgi:hypothetical protein